MVKQKDIPSPAKKRELILQALYQKEISGVSNTEVMKQLKERNKKYDLSDLNLVLKGIKQNKQTIDEMIEQNSKLELKDIGEIGDTIENLFVGEEQCQKARAKKSGMGAGDQFGIKSVAQEVIDAKLAQEKMQEMRNLIDLRFGPGTWQSIVDLRARKMREAREAALQAKREEARKQKEFNEMMMTGATIVIVIGLMVSALIYLAYIAV